MSPSTPRLVAACMFLCLLAGCAAVTRPGTGDGAITPDSGAPVDVAPSLDADPGPSERTCNAATECAWGEIDHEILRPQDCLCLFGCPRFPLNRATVVRRDAQYAMRCRRGFDGMGRPCPIDDCVQPPPLECRMSQCVPPGG